VDALTPVSLAIAGVLGFLVLVLPRRYALVPMLIAGCYMTLGQALLLGGIHLYLMRILILFGIVRVVIRRELFRVHPNGIDRVWLAWLLVSCLLYVVADGTHVPALERLGDLYNAVGIYCLVRALVKEFDDVVLLVKAFAIIIVPLAVLFVVERATGQNPFAVLGGVPWLSEVRNGQVRCQGPFKHAILAGTFGATAMPLFVGLWVSSARQRALATLAIVAATVIVMNSASSGAFTAFFLGIAGLLCWPFKAHMRPIRWGIVATVLALAAVMKAPVWFVIDRASGLVGGDGWYRSQLIDSAIRHSGEWWLLGTGYTAHWMETGILANPNSADIVNEFVNQGIRGGLLALGLFIWLLVKCFKTTGLAIRSEDRPRAAQFMIWSMGCTVLAHVASFFSVTYFDQIIIFWYLIIGMIASLGQIPAVSQEVNGAGVRLAERTQAAFGGQSAQFQGRFPHRSQAG
jgi:hypothetical protein